jgi:hypothetical protein
VVLDLCRASVLTTFAANTVIRVTQETRQFS